MSKIFKKLMFQERLNFGLSITDENSDINVYHNLMFIFYLVTVRLISFRKFADMF